MVLLWSTSVEKRIVALPPFLASFFYLAFLFFWGQCSINDDHHTSIYLQLNDYNSILRTKYDSIWMPPAVYRDSNDAWVTCTKELWTVALPQLKCQLHDHAKQYDNHGACHNKWNGGKLQRNISRNGYGNAIIGRYDGCFEEDIRRFMCDRAYCITGFGCTGEVCTNSQGEKGQCTVP